MTIRVPRLTWILGDAEQDTQSGVTVVTRTLYYSPHGDDRVVRVGTINPDYAERVMNALEKGSQARP